jgi:hypothetical protein
MKKTLFLLVLGIPVLARDPLAQRIGHTDSSKYTRERSHASAGEMACETGWLGIPRRRSECYLRPLVACCSSVL